MFKNKGMKTAKKPSVVEPKVTNPSIHVMGVNMVITKSKVTEKQVFKDKEPFQKKFTTNWEEEQRLQQYFVKTI
jgi:hypothetical protein